MKVIQEVLYMVSTFLVEHPLKHRWQDLAKKPLGPYATLATEMRWRKHHEDVLVDALLWGTTHKTFHIPDETKVQTLEQQAWEGYCEANKQLTAPSQRVYDPELLRRVQANIRSLFKGIYYDLDDAWWGPNANLSTKKDVSYLFKERSRVTVYSGTQYVVAALLLHRRAQYQRYKRRAEAYYGRRCTREELLYYTAGTFKKVRGAKFTSVDKNNDARRGIAKEASGNTLIQRVAMAACCRALLRNASINTDTLADVHRVRISFMPATLDIKGGSDGAHRDDPEFFGYPRWLRNLLNAGRASFIEYNGELVYNRILSSMGNTATFPIMMCTLLAIARVFDPKATVFGDDIIIANECVDDFIAALTSLTNYKVNKDKSFWGGDRVRESCGAYYVAGFGYVTSYKMYPPTGWASLIAFCNKWLRTARQTRDAKLRNDALKLHKQMVQLLRAHLKDGPEVDCLPEYLMSQDWVPCQLNRNGRRAAEHLQLEVFNASVVRTTNPTKVVVSEASELDFIPLDLSIRFGRNPTRERRGADTEEIRIGVFDRQDGTRLA